MQEEEYVWPPRVLVTNLTTCMEDGLRLGPTGRDVKLKFQEYGVVDVDTVYGSLSFPRPSSIWEPVFW